MATILVISEHSHQSLSQWSQQLHCGAGCGRAHTFASMWTTWLWYPFSTSSLQGTPFCHTSCDACSFSLLFISFTSLPSISLAHQTLLWTRCLVTIFTFFLCWSHRCNKSLSQPLFKSSSYSSHPIGPRLAGQVCFVAPYPGTCFFHTCDI